MMQKNRLLSAFYNSLSEMSHMITGEAKSKVTILKKQIKNLLTSEKDWNTFKIYFEQVNKDFLSKLKEINPELTSNDIRLATLMKLNMTNKEIASILNINYQSVKNAQYRLKNKLNLDNEDLRRFLAEI
jgi:DNA-binding NarL/FixJ family response regulator